MYSSVQISCIKNEKITIFYFLQILYCIRKNVKFIMTKKTYNFDNVMVKLSKFLFLSLVLVHTVFGVIWQKFNEFLHIF